MNGTFIPVFSLTTTTLAVLLAALFVLSLRAVFRRTIACPADARQAEVAFEQRKRTPWAKAVRLDVVGCSLQPGGVTCAKRCLGCVSAQS